MFDITAKRGQQFAGGQDSPDVVHGIDGLHIEVKHVEKLNLRKAMDQSVRDAGTNLPTVFHKKNYKPWLVTLRLDDLPRFISILKEYV